LPLEEDSSQAAFPFMGTAVPHIQRYFDPASGEINEENQR